MKIQISKNYKLYDRFDFMTKLIQTLWPSVSLWPPVRTDTTAVMAVRKFMAARRVCRFLLYGRVYFMAGLGRYTVLRYGR